MKPLEELSTQQLIQLALDQHVVDEVADLPYVRHDGVVTDYDNLRAWLIDAIL